MRARFFWPLSARFFISACHRGIQRQLQSGSVQVAGSETMRAVMTACAEDFMTRHPQSDIVVKGGGSGDGIAALFAWDGRYRHDVAGIVATRARLRAIQSALTFRHFRAGASMASPSSSTAPIRSQRLIFAQLRDIFAGNVGNWREFGSRDTDIVPIARAPRLPERLRCSMSA